MLLLESITDQSRILLENGGIIFLQDVFKEKFVVRRYLKETLIF